MFLILRIYIGTLSTLYVYVTQNSIKNVFSIDNFLSSFPPSILYTIHRAYKI